MTRRRLRPLAALAIVALIGAGCSNDRSTTGTATSTATGSAKSAGEKTVQFAECMREHGVSEFPDPNGSSDQEFVEGMKRVQGSAAWKKALSACKDLRPPGLLGAKATPKEMTARLKFAQCIRENGVKDFPDPVDGQPLIDTNRIPSANREGGMTVLHAAMQKCRDLGAVAIGNK